MIHPPGIPRLPLDLAERRNSGAERSRTSQGYSSSRRKNPTSARVVAFQQLNNSKYSVLLGSSHRDWMSSTLAKSLSPGFPIPVLTPAPPLQTEWNLRKSDADGDDDKDLAWLQRRRKQIRRERLTGRPGAGSTGMPHSARAPARTQWRPTTTPSMPKLPQTARGPFLLSHTARAPRTANTYVEEDKVEETGRYPPLEESERSIGATLRYLHSDFFKLRLATEKAKRRKLTAPRPKTEDDDFDLVADDDDGGSDDEPERKVNSAMVMGPDGLKEIILPNTLNIRTSLVEAPTVAKPKAVRPKYKIVVNPNMIRPSRSRKSSRSASPKAAQGSPSQPSAPKLLNDGENDQFSTATMKSTGWGSIQQRAKRKQPKAQAAAAAATATATATAETSAVAVVAEAAPKEVAMVPAAVPNFMTTDKRQRRRQEDKEDEDVQEEKQRKMGVFPDWLWERDDFQSIQNQPLTDTCLRILGNVTDERQELHTSKLRTWITAKKDGAKIAFLAKLPPKVLGGVVKGLKLMRMPADQFLYRERQTGETFFMLYAGTMEASSTADGTFRTINAGETFGHNALDAYEEATMKRRRARGQKRSESDDVSDKVRQQVRRETVRTVTDCVVLTLGFYDYDSMQLEYQKQQSEEMVTFLKGLATFSKWENTRIRHLHSAMQPKTLKRGDVIWKQGAPANTVVLVLHGLVSVFRTIEVTEARRMTTASVKQWQTEETRSLWGCKVRTARTGTLLGLEAFTGSTKRDFTLKVRSERAKVLVLKQHNFINFYAKDVAAFRSDVDVQRHTAAVTVTKMLAERYPGSHERYPIPVKLWALQGEEVRETHYCSSADLDLENRVTFYGLDPGMIYVKFNPDLGHDPDEHDSSPEESRPPSPEAGSSSGADEMILMSSPPYKMPTAYSYQVAKGETEAEQGADAEDTDEEGEVDDDDLEPDTDFVPMRLLLRADNKIRSVLNITQKGPDGVPFV